MWANTRSIIIIADKYRLLNIFRSVSQSFLLHDIIFNLSLESCKKKCQVRVAIYATRIAVPFTRLDKSHPVTVANVLFILHTSDSYRRNYLGIDETTITYVTPLYVLRFWQKSWRMIRKPRSKVFVEPRTRDATVIFLIALGINHRLQDWNHALVNFTRKQEACLLQW